VGRPGTDFRDGSDAAEESFCEAELARSGDLAVEKFFDAAVTLEIGGDEFCGFFLVDAELLSDAERGAAVNEPAIADFGDAAVLGRLREGRNAENFLGGARVDVFAAA